MKDKEPIIYCSLDIETSGFDPLTNEVLEVGFVFFKVSDSRFKITEEWTQVFKPSKPVGPQILGLTGISQKELDEAPLFSDYHQELQDKLGHAIIVGHNISFDIKFLEAFGLKFSGQTIDTLDLVQWLLPTHHSYNLENLMHSFGISHKEAHRALADSKATLKLLEKLLGIFNGLPEKLQQTILGLIESRGFLWADLLAYQFKAELFAGDQSSAKVPAQAIEQFKFHTKTIYNFGLGQNYTENLAKTLSKSRNKSLLVLPKTQQVLRLYKEKLVSGAAFLPEAMFDETNFDNLLAKPDLNPDELKFLLKVLVWRHTNWQTKTILDLNLSFFGGQFRSLITGGQVQSGETSKVVACDLATFFYLGEHKLYQDRQVIIFGLNDFESAITGNIGTKTSWGYINYLLKSFYNPENLNGSPKFRQAVEDGLLASDLFFGLASALWQTEPPSFQYVRITDEVQNSDQYQKVTQAGQNFIDKLTGINEILRSTDIKKFTGNLKQFFSPEANRVKWVELAEKRCAFISMPIDISGLTAEAIKPFSKISFADCLSPKQLPEFFVSRLGLDGFNQLEVISTPLETGKKSKQGDLFAGAAKLWSKKSGKINFYYLPQTANAKDLMEIIKTDKSLPAAILFPGPLPLKEFYEQNYEQLKHRASVLAQLHSGGSNKIFRNFSINPKALLLATDKFILRNLNSVGAVETMEQLTVRTLVICRLPFEQFTHPYQEAVSKSMPNAFMDYALPKALFNFAILIKFFYGPELKDVYIIDPKLSKDYAKVFKDFYQYLPQAVLKS